jgi:acetyl-CoA acetyltransferase
MKSNVYILGVGMTPMKSRWIDATYWKLAQLAGRALLETMDPQYDLNNVSFASFGIYNDIFEGHAIPETFLNDVLGWHLKEMDRVTTGGQTGMATMTRVYDAIASGRHKLGLALGVEKALDCFDPQTNSQTPMVVDTIAFSWPFWTQWKLGVTASSSYAQIINGYRAKYPEDLGLDARALFIEEVCRHGLKNKLAQRYPEKITAQQVKESRIIISDIRLGEVCVYSEGAVAVLLGDEDMARECSRATKRPLMRIAGIGHSTESTYIGRQGFQHQDIHLIESDKVAAERAYEMAGIGPGQIRVVGQHCAFGPQGLITLAMMGFAPIGRSQDLVHDGTIMEGGKLVVDPYGGLIYAGHAVGASNMMSLYEVYNYMIEKELEFGAVHGTGGADAVYGGVHVIQNMGGV